MFIHNIAFAIKLDRQYSVHIIRRAAQRAPNLQHPHGTDAVRCSLVLVVKL